MAQRVRLLHWNAAEAEVLRNLLVKAKFMVEYQQAFDSTTFRKWREDPPAAFVIDLSRLPSHGREIAIALRQSPKTRYVPIVFCNGAEEKVTQIREILPDAEYCTSAELVGMLRTVRPAATPVKPVPMMHRYESRPVTQKLGLKERQTLALIDPPANIMAILGQLPDGASLVEEDADVTLSFIRSPDSLRSEMSRLRTIAGKTKLWILWRKKSAKDHDGVSERLVRETGIDLGLVDYKICSVDQTWSGMLFARRK